MKFAIPIALMTSFASLSGCAKDYSLAPPADSELVTVTVKVPKELETEPMWVMYRSKICTFTDHSAYGTPYKRDDYQRMDIRPVRVKKTDLYEAELPIEGGGECQWRLSNVTFGVVYKNTEKFGERVTYGTGGGVVVIFDRNNSPHGGSSIKVEGDLAIKKDYYPWLDEAFIGGHETTINLLGEGVHIYLMYQALQARKVYFEPILHSDFLVGSVGPKVKKKGNHVIFNYPDGSVESLARVTPNFRKLQAIRLAAEANK